MKLIHIMITLAFGTIALTCCTDDDPASSMTEWGDAYKEITTPDKNLRLFMPEVRAATPTPLILILPGGGYNTHTPSEGIDWVPFCINAGYAAAVLDYDLPAGNPDRPINHVIRTIEYLRTTPELRIDPASVGVMGFSAGAHLASIVATERPVESRPAFQVLFYPVISMLDEHVTTQVHGSTRVNLLGEAPSQQLREQYSSQLRVDESTPETFLAVGDADMLIVPSNSYLYIAALNENEVANVMMIAPGGMHGYADWANKSHILQTLADWLRQRIPLTED